MNPFTYVRPSTVDDAVREFAANPNAAYIAGGTNLIDCMKIGSISADRLIDITALPFTGIAEHNGASASALLSAIRSLQTTP
jgi:xanthine dehydrogenase YagS FAD-binding subunit